ncbi:D-aminoacylase [Lysobacter sp. M2-1]|uniref:N-acyl-D-amino-acid deacylase family protein n=1 Tax=Lysobacter sp. M2-1 TaxID=2916839 RepID=UPI001F57D742|nr:D-aminoacylase [Lysobacter sp. M2-1]
MRTPILLASVLLAACASAPSPAPTAKPYDLLIRNGVVYDGSGEAPKRVDVAIRGDRVVELLAPGAPADANEIVDAHGLAVAPGFINVLSWAGDALIEDGRGMSDTLQGVTLEIFGEGTSGGPLTPAMKTEMLQLQDDIRYDITWDSFGGYLEHLERKGVTPNVASFVGATTVRQNVIGNAPRAATAEEVARMQALVRQAMREGALGVGSSLIYEPATNAETSELVALAKAAGESGGGYISHIRDEGEKLLESIDELIAIGRAAGVHAEAYHLKASGVRNWPKMAQAIARIEAAREAGQPVTADMYLYPASSTGLDTQLPKWVREGGAGERIARLKDPVQRGRAITDVKAEIARRNPAELDALRRTLLVQFRSESLKPLTGRTLAEVAEQRGTDLATTIVDLIAGDESRVGVVFFSMSEDNVRLGLRQPWVSLGSDGASEAPEGVFLKGSTHPRAYGNFARLFARYVREEQLLSVQEAVRRVTALPARNWKLASRGCLDPGCHADIVVFDPATIQDHASFAKPMQYATGVRQVWINGVRVVRDGAHTGATPGRVVRGPGWKATR